MGGISWKHGPTNVPRAATSGLNVAAAVACMQVVSMGLTPGPDTLQTAVVLVLSREPSPAADCLHPAAASTTSTLNGDPEHGPDHPDVDAAPPAASDISKPQGVQDGHEQGPGGLHMYKPSHACAEVTSVGGGASRASSSAASTLEEVVMYHSVFPLDLNTEEPAGVNVMHGEFQATCTPSHATAACMPSRTP